MPDHVLLTHSEMPPPGPDFIGLAADLGDTPIVYAGKGAKAKVSACGDILQDLHDSALYDSEFVLPVAHNGRRHRMQLLGGNLWGQVACGPKPCRVYVLGERPGEDEMTRRKNFIGISSVSLYRALKELAVPPETVRYWYLSNVCWHEPLPGVAATSKKWIKNCRPLVEAEIRIGQPDFILVFGAKAAAAILGLASVSVSSMVGRTVEYPIHSPVDGAFVKMAKLVVVPHPASVYHSPESYDTFRAAMSDFVLLLNGHERLKVEPDVHHEVIDNLDRLNELVDSIVNDPDPASRLIAVDCEWHLNHPDDEGAYLRSIQFSHKPKHGYCVKLRHCGGAPAFYPNVDAAIPPLLRLLKSTPERKVRPIVHFGRRDILWLASVGIDLRPEMRPPPLPEIADIAALEAGAALTRDEGGIDLYVCSHSVFENAERGLEALTSRYTGIPRYDLWVEDFKKAYKVKHKKPIAGYGDIDDCPEWDTYTCYDVDGPRRIADLYMGVNGQPGMLDCDMYGMSVRVPYYLSMLAWEAICQMEANGAMVNRERVNQLMLAYENARRRLTAELRTQIRWPDFNARSVFNCRELLFGHELSGLLDKTTGAPQRKRPIGALCLNLEPIKSSGKPSKPWARIVRDGLVGSVWPATDKEVLGIFGHTQPIAKLLRNVRFLEKLCSTNLPSDRLKDRGEHETDELTEDDMELSGGIFMAAGFDGRMRTSFGQAETGRLTSFRPPLQNLAKRREAQYKQILGSDYTYPVRSSLRAMPGCVLVEADIMSAEVAGMAWVSNDPAMIEDVRRNMLPKSHPDYLDIHSGVAVQAFRLDCEPTEAALEAKELAHLRVGAKNFVFGIPYQRGTDALVRQCHEEGAFISLAEGEMLHQGYFDRWPGTELLLDECKSGVTERGWLMTSHGRIRHFLPADSDEVAAAQEREGCNLPIQGLVADHMLISMHLVNEARRRWMAVGGPWFNMILQIHDALLFEIRPEWVGWLYDNVITPCMSTRIPVWPRRPDGTFVTLDRPYHFGVDVKVFESWGEKPGKDRLLALGVDPRFV